MVISAEPIIYGLIFVAVLVLVEGIYLTVFGKSISLNSRVNRRLEMLEKGQGREQVLEQLRKEMTQHMKSRSIPLYAILADKAQKANIAFTPTPADHDHGACSACVAFFGLTFGTGAAPAGPHRRRRSRWASAASMSGSTSKAKKRMSMIEEQLPDAVELMVRSPARRPPVLVGRQHRRQGSPRSAGHRNGRDRRRGRLWPRHGRKPEGDGRTHRHAGHALPRRRGDHPAAVGRQPGRDPRRSGQGDPRRASSCSAGSRRSPPRPNGRACSCRSSRCGALVDDQRAAAGLLRRGQGQPRSSSPPASSSPAS